VIDGTKLQKFRQKNKPAQAYWHKSAEFLKKKEKNVT
jgi:hypothetical protein